MGQSSGDEPLPVVETPFEALERLGSRAVGRLAPSPSGRMHAGNLFMALLCWLIVRSFGGSLVLRIEDIDAERSKASHADQLLWDFERLGLTWDRGPLYQSDHLERYRAAFETLRERGLLYPCFCSRADLAAARAPHRGERAVYDGRCRRLAADERLRRLEEGRRHCWRLAVPDVTLDFEDALQGCYRQRLADECGDFIVRRSDGGFGYQLAVVIDDADEGVNCVVRGKDLLSSTPQQRYLKGLLYGCVPNDIIYAHGPLLVDGEGRRLAKRQKDASLDVLLERYGSPAAVIGVIAGLTGLAESSDPIMPEQLLAYFDPRTLPKRLFDISTIRWPDPASSA